MVDDGVRRKMEGNGGEVNIYIIIILLFIRPATWRKCNATVTDDGDDDEVDNGVDSDDEGGGILYF